MKRFWILDFGFWIGAAALRRGVVNSKALLCALGVLCGSVLALADTNEFLLVRRSLQVQPIHLVAISDQFVEHLPADKSWEKIPLAECIALLNPEAKKAERTAGMLALADGQRLPGEAVANAKPTEAIAWNHPWLGRIDVPLKLVESVAFTLTASAPTPGAKDVVLLANGDRQEGLIAKFGSVISLEVDRGGKSQNIEIPLNLVAGISIVAGKQPVIKAKRVWFDEGTVIDVQSIAIGDDGFVRLGGSGLAAGTQPTRVGISQIAAILLDSQGLIPLASLSPTRVEGPATRFTIPKPTVQETDAPLNLSAIEYAGPMTARYALPVGCQRFTSEAELPRAAWQWGDFELVIRSNDTEVFRARLNGTNPTATINVPLTGRELTIELTQGANGPIQDRLVLERPMLLMGR